MSFQDNGTAITLPLVGQNDEANVLFQLNTSSPFNPFGSSSTLTLKAMSDISELEIILELNVNDIESCFPIGKYDSQTLDGSIGRISLSYNPEGWLTFPDIFTTVEITKCDFDNKLISGIFSSSLNPFDYPGPMEITNGKFENVCFVEE